MFSFDNVIGNQKNILNMKQSISNRKIFHSYIISGENGIGKLFITNCFAKMIQCEKNTSNDNCYSCRTFESKNNPDIIYVTATKTKNLGVDDIREQIKAQAQTKPYVCKYKIFILENADKMTVAAQNALLKILEEPPEFVIFFLLAENTNNFLPTIISRCAQIKIKPAEILQVEKFLTKKNIDAHLAKIYAMQSQGNIGRAMKFASNNNFLDMRNKILELIKKLKSCDIASALLFENEFEKFKDNIETALDIIYLWYSDLILYRESRNVSYICNTDKLGEIIQEVDNYDNLYDKMYVIEKAKKYLNRNTNFKLTLNVMLLELSGR